MRRPVSSRPGLDAAVLVCSRLRLLGSALPAARPPAARASDAGVAAVSAFAMRPRAPGPLWPLPWGALAWAVGFVGSLGSGDPAPGEWGGRKGRAGRATHVGLPGMRAGG